MNPAPIPRRPLRQRVACSLLALALSAALPWRAQAQAAAPSRPPAQTPLQLPALGESASDEFTLNAEKRLGEQIMRDIRRDPDYVDDPLLLDYLQSIWQPLVHAARARGSIGADTETLFPYESFLVRDRSVNAFALPGGYVGVHLGLIAMTATRDELASVLAHEFSHITQRHIARGIVAAQRGSSIGLAAMILGILVASRASSTDAAQAAIVGGQAAMVQSQLNFSRDMEREADRFGLALMSDAGFAPGGMAAMFEKLEQANRHNDSGGFPYLRSHPLTGERIGEVQQRIASLGAEAPAPIAAPARLHALMQARARVLMDGSVQALRRAQELDGHSDAAAVRPADGGATASGATAAGARPDERMASLYASALASTQLRDFARAGQALAAAQALLAAGASARHIDTERVLAQLGVDEALARGDVAAAGRVLATLADDRSRSALLLRARFALASGDATAVRLSSQALQTWVAEHREDASAWQWLAQCADRLGQRLRSVRAEAESQAALGNLPGAIDRLRAGQQLARRGEVGTDFIEASVIDARLRDLLAQRRQLLAEQRGNGRRNGGGEPPP